MIKDHWDNLSERERRVLSIGGVLVFIFLVYALLWSPLSDAVSDYHHRVVEQRQLLQFLKNAQQKIQLFEKQGVVVGSGNDSDLLTLTEKTLSSQHLSMYLKQVQEPKQKKITLTFEKVPFDALMQWLNQLIKLRNVDVTQFSAEKLPDVGTANVTMTLSI
ncbi:MAG: hypothetical protein ACD_42C00104G0002 [uncultured bacterium]|nr:MAG: hypothetical protein ACD_42C00104G0002 [uncultured bacterium]OGT25702.1 MAG: hypothetical protein A3B71_01030 [Gammaproteobacteria bacterium RIFCSPHIGHO2_02_FULL_42_43]OGT51650.1 MAG: hypothetical protein A3E54_03245 [Gammaproteobacteria bacterium RIFCSPHIGHO2_12_FULL_41_25]OGT61548.1 MAG: hypothetical protein A3I77_03050 [Gammaproteobacteria bacterium RIFCSPLOWO2_02_FULL_42_14]OGT86171.1 MAG: hypothetical protein A3G86_05900 [Gammaproteobacteria bacterium RIFCSPLOWO2_12_FULL_42_18]